MNVIIWTNYVVRLCEKAKDLLKTHKNIHNKCIIFDIDDTIINSIYKTKIIPVIDLYTWAYFLDYTIFIITARADFPDNRQQTIKELKECRIFNYKYLYMREENELDIYKYKLECRKNIYENGYNCIMSVGDNLTDIGEYGGIGVLIPLLV